MPAMTARGGDGGAGQKQENLGKRIHGPPGFRSSSICEKCFRRTANRARGISPSKIAFMVGPPESAALRESRSVRQHKNHALAARS